MRKLSPLRSQVSPLLFPEQRVKKYRLKYVSPRILSILDRSFVHMYYDPFDLPHSTDWFAFYHEMQQKEIESIRYEFEILSMNPY